MSRTSSSRFCLSALLWLALAASANSCDRCSEKNAEYLRMLVNEVEELRETGVIKPFGEPFPLELLAVSGGLDNGQVNVTIDFKAYDPAKVKFLWLVGGEKRDLFAKGSDEVAFTQVSDNVGSASIVFQVFTGSTQPVLVSMTLDTYSLQVVLKPIYRNERQTRFPRFLWKVDPEGDITYSRDWHEDMFFKFRYSKNIEEDEYSMEALLSFPSSGGLKYIRKSHKNPRYQGIVDLEGKEYLTSSEWSYKVTTSTYSMDGLITLRGSWASHGLVKSLTMEQIKVLRASEKERPLQDMPLQFINDPQSQQDKECIVGRRCDISCQVYGDQPQSLDFFQETENGTMVPLEMNGRNESSNYTLRAVTYFTPDATQASDQGKFECRATAPNGSVVSHEFSIRYVFPMEVIRNESTLRWINDSKTLELNCTFLTGPSHRTRVVIIPNGFFTLHALSNYLVSEEKETENDRRRISRLYDLSEVPYFNYFDLSAYCLVETDSTADKKRVEYYEIPVAALAETAEARSR